MSHTAMEVLARCKKRLDEGGTMHHPFLLRFERTKLSRDRLDEFLTQWYKTSTAHRWAFPSLIANIKDDNVRFNLIDILNEEYGNGQRSRIHVRLLENLLIAAGLEIAEVDRVEPLPSIRSFSSIISDVWSSSEPPKAFGLHFGMEYLASSQQNYCSRGMAQYEFLTAQDREYFDIHAEAEVRHVAYSEDGFCHYAQNLIDREKLVDGVNLADRLLNAMWSEYETMLFSGPGEKDKKHSQRVNWTLVSDA
jgi:pyrroloquinoline quinone (PQQ) biosynthesis protein C